jgi:hypothetical protein
VDDRKDLDFYRLEDAEKAARADPSHAEHTRVVSGVFEEYLPEFYDREKRRTWWSLSIGFGHMRAP